MSLEEGGKSFAKSLFEQYILSRNKTSPGETRKDDEAVSRSDTARRNDKVAAGLVKLQ